MKLKQEEFNKIKEYVVECLIEDFLYNRDDAIKMVDNSPFPLLLKNDPDYVLHYNFEFWAEYVTSNFKC